MVIPDVSNKPIAQLVSLAGRAAIVTGGARGIGRAVASRLAEAGAAVLIADLDAAAALTTAAELREAHGARVRATRLDVTDGASILAAAGVAEEQFGRIDIWVNNAGIFPAAPLLEVSDDQWDRVQDVNLRGVFIGCREAARRMTAAGRGGVIVNLASTAGFRGMGPGGAAYVASKHGVRGLTRQLAIELAPYGIRVLAVAPTFVQTEGTLALTRRTAGEPAALQTTRLGRPGAPDDVARVVLFCASDMSMFMTGSTLPVDAGDIA
jgi:NAD(P)-dependent dehydrogenase (short-subunit alcohol dehydrogenase family)